MIGIAMSMNPVPGMMIGVFAPALGLVAAAALAGIVFGFVSIGRAALRPTRRAISAKRLAPLEHLRQAA